MSKTIVITGASSGFGLILAKQLHTKGYKVIGTSRTPEKYDKQLPFKLLKLNLDNDESISSFAQQLFTEVKQIDILVNNAGFMITGVAEETPIELGRHQFETNFWGTIKLTNVLLPYFRKQRSGHIITLSSIVGLIGPPNLAYYAASKHALEGYFKALRFELNQFNIKISMVQPSWFKTNLGENAIVNEGSIRDYDGYRNKLDAFTNDGIQKADDPIIVCNKIQKLIETQEPPFKNLVGKMSRTIVFLQNNASKLFEKTMLSNVQKTK